MAVGMLAFHITDRCQLDCQHCLRDPEQTPKDLPLSLIRKVLAEAKARYRTHEVALTGGEPEHLTSSPIDEFRGAISPDGNEMAYHTFETGWRNLFLLPLDGGPARHCRRARGEADTPRDRSRRRRHVRNQGHP